MAHPKMGLSLSAGVPFLFLEIASGGEAQMDSVTSFVYGMNMMFFSMMAWLFWRKGKDLLFRMIMWLMLVVDAQCVKDLLLFHFYGFKNDYTMYLTSSLDMMIIPLYSFVLMELVKPGWFGWMKAFMLELPFLLLPVFYILTNRLVWFYILTVWSGVYGCVTFLTLIVLIRGYHRQLKERFSYQENINLNWLLAILNTFFLILLVWVVSCFVVDADFDNLYMLCNLVLWMFISYFVYRHESVIDELSDVDMVLVSEEPTENEVSGLASEVIRLFEVDKIYLDSKLKLSDVARRVGTNRTYLSRYFNQENGKTFYDFVNNYRIKYAEQLLLETTAPLLEISERSGFNSLSTFRRVFTATHGCSPSEYRNRK